MAFEFTIIMTLSYYSILLYNTTELRNITIVQHYSILVLQYYSVTVLQYYSIIVLHIGPNM